MKDIPAHMCGPKRSDDAHDFWNYGMTKEELVVYLNREQPKQEPPKLIAAE
jgi:hypothetical protein